MFLTFSDDKITKMKVQRKNSSRLIDRLIVYIGLIVLITMTSSTSAQSPNCEGSVDLFLTIDASFSNSIKELEEVCEFVVSVCNELYADLGPRLRIGVLFFATDPYPHLEITNNLEDVVKFLKTFQRIIGNNRTNLGKALQKVLEEFRSTWKPSAYKRVLIITDGNANDRPVVLDVLRQFEQYDVKVVAVGINTQVSHITDTSIKINGQFTEQIIDQVAINICRDTAGPTGPIVPPDTVVFDAFFVIDESHGNIKNFGISVKFIEKILRTFISSRDVSVLKYGTNVLRTTPNNFIPPKPFNEELYAALGQLTLNVLNLGGRNLNEALRIVKEILNERRDIDGGQIQNPVVIVIMMTDASDDQQDTISRARSLIDDNPNEDIYIIIIGIGVLNPSWENQMILMASNPSLVFSTDDFGLISGETQESTSFIVDVRQAIYELVTNTYEPTTDDTFTWSSNVDLHFMVDGSNNMVEIPYFALVRTVIAALAESLELGPDAGRVGMFLFDSGGTYADIGFDSYQYDINQFKERLYGLRRIERTPSGDINIALEESLAYIEANGRENAAKIAILFTLGGQYNMILSQAYYRTMKMRGIQLMIVAIGPDVNPGALSITMLDEGYLRLPEISYMASTENIDLFITDVQYYSETPVPVGIYPPWPTEFDYMVIVDRRLADEDGGNDIKGTLIDIANRLINWPTSRMGVIVFGDAVQDEIRLTATQSKEGLILRIVGLDLSLSGEPNLLEALELAQNRFSTDGRNGVEKVMALFLSGDLTIGNAENVVAAELLNDGIKTTVFYSGPNADWSQFSMLAFHPQLATEISQPFLFSPKFDADLIALASGTYVPNDPQNDILDANCQREADIIFLLDASVSMVDYFDEVKQSVVKLMYTFKMARFGVHAYGSEVLESGISLGEYSSYVDNRHAVLALEPDMYSANTFTDKAIEEVSKEFDSDSDNEKLLVIVTDGLSQNVAEAREAADNARAEGIDIMALGIGQSIYQDGLLNIADESDNVFMLTGNDRREQLMEVHARMCEIIQPDEICEAGEYLSNGCELCPPGTYKENSGPGPCMPCPNDRPNTEKRGSKSIDDCITAECNTPIDLIFVIDASASIESTAVALKIYLLSLLEKFNLGPTNVQVAFATIKDETRPEDVTDFFSNINDVFNYLFNQLVADGAYSTNTASAFDMVRTMIKNRARTDTPAVVITFTDGRSNNQYLTALKANLLKLFAKSIVFGVGKFVLYEELLLIASKQEFIFVEPKFSDLTRLEVVGTICAAAEEWMPYVPPADTICGLPIDILFVMDMSESTSFGAQSLMIGLTGLATELLDVEKNIDMRIGVMSYGATVNTNDVLIFSNSETEILDVIRLQTTSGIETNTHLAIPYAQNLFNEHGRADAFHLVCFFTDGYSSDLDQTRIAANEFHKAGGNSIAVGHDGADLEELQALSSDGSKNVIIVPTFAILDSDLILDAACPEKFICSHPMDVVFILYLDDMTLLPAASQFFSDLEERFPLMEAVLIQEFVTEGEDTLPTALGIALYQILTRSPRTDTIRHIIVMTDSDPSTTNQTSLEQAVTSIKDNGMIISFIVSGNTASPWNPFATSELTSFLNQYYNDPVATAETYWHLCKEPCKSGYELVNADCEECSVDTYRDASRSYQCIQCDSDRSTRNKTGSTSSDNCYLIEDPCFGGFELLDDGTCRACPLGTFRTAFEQSVCTECPENFITVYIGSGSEDECVSLCDLGHFWSYENNECTECDPGTYADEKNQTTCKPCHENNLMVTVDDTRTFIVSGATSADQCAANCGTGNFFNETLNDGECVQCPENTYQSLLYRGECAACRPGEISNVGSTSEANCFDPCESGETWDFDLKTCVPCGTGRYRNKLNDNICQDCPFGLSTNTETADSEELCESVCLPGTEWNEDKLSCFECLPETYRSDSSSDTCVPCPPGLTSPLGSDDLTDCTSKCYSGQVWDTDECVPCPIGTYRDVEDDICVQCNPGDTTPNIGSYSSSLCTPETGACGVDEWACSNGDCVPADARCNQAIDCIDESDEDNCCDPSCTDCVERSFFNQVYCIPCPAGTSTADGFTCEDDCPSGKKFDVAIGDCVNCGKGFYRLANRDDPFTCIRCPSNFTTEFLDSDDIDKCCVECLEGQFYNRKDKRCEDCDVGYYQSGTFDEYDCTRCPPGTTTNGNGSVSIADCADKCPDGKELPLEGTTVNHCVLCKAGTYKDDTKITCEPCGDGLTSLPGSDSQDDCYPDCTIGQEFNTNCADCGLGMFRDTPPVPGDSACIPCPAGNGTYFEKSDSEEDCQDVCNSGLELSNDKQECRTCELGYYRQRYVDTQCIRCPDYMTTLVVGSPNDSYCVDKCKSGFESVNDDVCTPCGLNRYRGRTDSQCLPCPNGGITFIEYATSIELCFPNCEPGTFVNMTTATCQRCSSVEYQDESGQRACKICPNNFHNNGINMSDVSHCKAGWCGPGYYTLSKDQPCLPCGFNRYKDENDTGCKPCENNEITFVINATSSDMCHPYCSPGFFANTTTSTCQPCPQSTYQNVSGQDSCIICPNNYHTKGTGTVNESDCRADWCENGYKYVQGICKPCGYGFYRRVTDPECLPCDPGLTTLTDTASSEQQCQVPPPAPTNNCSSKFDLVIAVDLSRTSCDNFVVQNLKAWLTDLVTRLDVHSRKIRVGIIRYGRKTSRLVDLRTGTSKRRLCSLLARGIKCSPYLSTNTHLALKDADFLFVRQSRSNCTKKLLLITASHDECLENTTKIAYKLKNGNTDLTVISSDPETGGMLASSKDSLFVISDYSTLPSVDSVVQALC